MNIPSLPTDNLYKFIALSGTLMFIIFTIVPQYIMNGLDKEINSVEHDLDVFKHEIKYIDFKDSIVAWQVKDLRNEIDKYQSSEITKNGIVYIDSIKEFIKLPENREYLQFMFDNMESIYPPSKLLVDFKILSAELIQLNFESSVKLTGIEFRNKLLVKKLEHLMILTVISTIGSILGLFMMAFGFYSWYFKVQIHLDKKLDNETKRLPYRISMNPTHKRRK